MHHLRLYLVALAINIGTLIHIDDFGIYFLFFNSKYLSIDDRSFSFFGQFVRASVLVLLLSARYS